MTADPAYHESIFEARLKRHDPAVALLRQNLTAQDNITKALVELNAGVAVKKHDLLEQRERRTEEVDSLIRSGESFGELLLKCDEGQDFYKQMSERLQKIRSELTELAADLEQLQPKPKPVVAPVVAAAAVVAPVTTPGKFL
ncbi:unnamed protein product [Dibothriocephalus latus]|uniref:ALIX V-shaped domain-containing protein n=1 Tax=Dibothriocephalus latus TaxID=60516 RepID=A0A3P6Q1Q9_DIBLA|nr:unnamed protein product [Dibothriocephalus latus]